MNHYRTHATHQSNPVLKKSVQLTIWQTDLHLGNIFVSEDSPPQILSLIDWQSIPIPPLFLQARWPVFLEPPDDYPEGLVKPKLASNYNELDGEEKKLADFKFNEINQAKGYEISSRLNNEPGYRAMTLPRVLKSSSAALVKHMRREQSLFESVCWKSAPSGPS
jgi:hypothetical protein